nr:reverse transcriptase domain-containing protein [Tanacetum cinerariifolium]
MSGVRSMARDVIQHNERSKTLTEPIRLTFGDEEVVKARTDAPSHRMPTNLKIYDGSTFPDDHVTCFVGAANQGEWQMPTDLEERFVERFTLRRKCCKDPTKVSKIIRRANETLPDFKEHWTEEMSYIQDVPEENFERRGKGHRIVEVDHLVRHMKEDSTGPTTITTSTVETTINRTGRSERLSGVKGVRRSREGGTGSDIRSDGLCRKTMMKFTMGNRYSGCPDGTRVRMLVVREEECKKKEKKEEAELKEQGGSKEENVLVNPAFPEQKVTIGLRIGRKMKVQVLKVKMDSRLVACQLNGELVASSKGMTNYLTKAKERGDSDRQQDQLVNDPFKQINTIVEHPQANSLVERANKSLMHNLKARLGRERVEQVDELPNILWDHRTMLKTSNGKTPFSLTYGSEVVILAEIGMPTYWTIQFNEAQNKEEMRLNMDLIQERRETATIREAKYKKDVEQYYNKRVRPVSFRVEDFVYRRNAASRVKTQGKLGPN